LGLSFDSRPQFGYILLTRARGNRLSTFDSEELHMKWFLLVPVLLTIAGLSSAQFTVCVRTDDVCCDLQESTNSFWMTNATDEIQTFYVHYETHSKANKAKVWCTVDGGGSIWTIDNLCGCGDAFYQYQVRGIHEVTIHVLCHYCTMPPCAGTTANVWVASPQTTTCWPVCSNPDYPGGE
jgi:hypothetical protein